MLIQLFHEFGGEFDGDIEVEFVGEFDGDFLHGMKSKTILVGLISKWTKLLEWTNSKPLKKSNEILTNSLIVKFLLSSSDCIDPFL